mmetsp:Transcript_52271/g.167601  ORF Transcript_52271/g.167601 Transcript_52271/m.167601 type:complete len:434 (-) Transcript_52271:358-1659(-)
MLLALTTAALLCLGSAEPPAREPTCGLRDDSSLAQLRPAPGPPGEGGGGRYAYVSLAYVGNGTLEKQASLTRSFLKHVTRLARRLRTARSRYPYVLLTDRPEDFGGLAWLNVVVRRLNETIDVPCSIQVRMYTGRMASTWVGAYQKLQAFGLEDFSKVLLLDFDVKLQGNLDHVFEVPLPNGGVAAQRNDDVCLGEEFDAHLDVPIVGQNSSRGGRDLLAHTSYARNVQRLFNSYAESTGAKLLKAEHGRMAQQRVSRSPRDTWHRGLNSGIMLLAPNRTDLREMQKVERFLPADCSEWWPDGADQVVVANYFRGSSRAWILPAWDASYSQCDFVYKASGYLPEGRTIKGLHATCEKYFPELIGAMHLLESLGVPRTAHGLLAAYWKASSLWGKTGKLRRRLALERRGKALGGRAGGRGSAGEAQEDQAGGPG